MKIALINRLTNIPAVTADDLQAFLTALTGQLAEISGRWGVLPPEALYLAESGDTLDENTVELGIWDQPDEPNAAGYHSVDPRGKPYGKVFWSVCDGVRTGPTLSLSQVLSHEACELWLNRFVNRYVLRTDGKTLDSCEVCDAVEDVVYKDPLGTGCDLSDYLLPAAFSDAVPGPWDRQGVLGSRYDTTSGGYRATLQAEVTDAGDMRIRCTAYYGPKHVMANSDPSEVEAFRQRAKSQGVRGRHNVAAVDWRPYGGGSAPNAASPFERARAMLQRPAVIIPPPPPVPNVATSRATGTVARPTASSHVNSTANRSAARIGPVGSPRVRNQVGTTHRKLNPTRRPISHPEATRHRAKNQPLPRRSIHFHEQQIQQAPALAVPVIPIGKPIAVPTLPKNRRVPPAPQPAPPLPPTMPKTPPNGPPPVNLAPVAPVTPAAAAPASPQTLPTQTAPIPATGRPLAVPTLPKTPRVVAPPAPAPAQPTAPTAATASTSAASTPLPANPQTAPTARPPSLRARTTPVPPSPAQSPQPKGTP